MGHDNWRSSAITRNLGLRFPILQGPFGSGHSSAELAAAVTNAGGLGAYGAHHLSGEEILALAGDIRRRCDGPFNLNLWIPREKEWGPASDPARELAYLQRLAPMYRELSLLEPAHAENPLHRFEDQVEAVLEARPAVFSFVFGIPTPSILARCAERGIRTLGAATTVAEAVALEAAGVDMVIASGLEAGGHRPAFLTEPDPRSLLTTFTLLPQVRDAVSIPVIAAGGIADRRGVRAAMALGADAVQVGTAFLACNESGASRLHKRLLHQQGSTDTVLTRVASGRMARYIRNRLTESSAGWPDPALPYPFQMSLTQSLSRASMDRNLPDFATMAAGQTAGLCRHFSAAELMAALIEDPAQAAAPTT
ncbi:nitronate monooxygenase [Microbulbifer sp. SH-1]|uniref:NAD(P)H-dependent flavin oxidoreductase n=1 Tax=Microbulbifer sp. SH-1 TaxID=2681547 RepID=UPI00140A9D3B|nr:nitronate monooxygenase [Microbulbifer sp. SH-1]QIL91301.1 nitronate monooxygenase [Microbulbifer sp. SH-1]